MSRNTSREAYKAIQEAGYVSKLQRRVYNWLFEAGPLTSSEITQRFKTESARKRLSELEKMGAVAKVGVRPCSITGRHVNEWDVTGSVPQPYKVRRPALEITFRIYEGEDGAEVMKKSRSGRKWKSVYSGFDFKESVGVKRQKKGPVTPNGRKTLVIRTWDGVEEFTDDLNT